MDRRRKAEAYALEMTIQLKRAEREKKRQELEIEFAAVFQEVDKKKKALAKLGGCMYSVQIIALSWMYPWMYVILDVIWDVES